MPRFRKSFKGWLPYRGSKKYSQENYFTSFTANSSAQSQEFTTYATMVDTTTGNVLGTRKCKNFTLKLDVTNLRYVCGTNNANWGNSTVDCMLPITWALIYLPEGLDMASINVQTMPNSVSL